MASISKDKSGNRTVQFVAADRRRRSIRLGKMTAKTADGIKAKVEALNGAAVANVSWDRETAEWVGKLEPKLYDKLAGVGLVPRREGKPHATLAAFLDEYIDGRTDVKPNTKLHLRRAKAAMVEYFGADRRLIDVTPGDADDFRLHFAKTLGPNTVRRLCGRAKQFFRAAVRKRLIAESPFADMKGTSVQANKSREFFITREIAAKVLDACPDAQWRLLFALARFGGLRCPSEVLELKWGDIDWPGKRITVRSPKTEHHEGKESRIIPIFPELRRYLDDAFAMAGEDGLDPKAPVISRYRGANANLRTQLERIIVKAKVKAWPKLFQNLRSTRETELANSYPIHVVCDWIGNSQAVAVKHYLQTTKQHFEDATKGDALQNPVQSGAAPHCIEQSPATELAPISAEFDSVPVGTAELVLPHGLEP